jgi:hypothetical protein
MPVLKADITTQVAYVVQQHIEGLVGYQLFFAGLASAFIKANSYGFWDRVTVCHGN